MKNNIENQTKQLQVAFKELKTSKMVLAEKQISKLLKVIAESDYIYNFIAERILGYDYNSELDAVLNGDLALEDITSSENLIPFTFCLLNEIDNQNQKLVPFIRQIFNGDTEDKYLEFCETIVSPFVNEILDAFNPTENLEEDSETKPVEDLQSLFSKDLVDRVRYVVLNITESVSNLKKVKPDLKRDIDIISYSIDLCFSVGEVAGIFGLLSGLKRCLIPLKKFKNEINEIDLILDTINSL